MTSNQISHDKLNITHSFLGCVFLNPTPAFHSPINFHHPIGPFPFQIPEVPSAFPRIAYCPWGSLSLFRSQPPSTRMGNNPILGKIDLLERIDEVYTYVIYIYVTCIHLVCSYRHNIKQLYTIYILYTKELTLQTGTRTRFQQRFFELIKYCFHNAMWCYRSVKLPQIFV